MKNKTANQVMKIIVVLNCLFIMGILIAIKNIDLVVNLFNLKTYEDTNVYGIPHGMEQYYMNSLLILYCSVIWLILVNILLLFMVVK
jgi:flagellar biosynthesis protein FlhB